MSIRIEEDSVQLLLVEGSDEKEFFIELAKHLFGSIPFQIMEYEGKAKLNDFLLAVQVLPNFSQIKHISIVRDADYETNAFASVCSALVNANKENSDVKQYPVPSKPSEPFGIDLRLSILILPDANSEGMLESLIIKALGEDKIMTCVDQYFECLETIGINAKVEPLPKATLNVYLAAAQMRTFIEGKNVGTEATKKDRKRQYLSDIYGMSWWNWNHPAFDSIKSFLKQLTE
jgi:hypothetical protein